MAGTATTRYTHMPSPIGDLLLAGDGEVIFLISFADGSKIKYAQAEWTCDAAPFAQAISQLQAYFAGELERFDLPIELRGTPFQVSVWEELSRIPFGSTLSYGELAQRIDRPKAVRAVGAANGANPVPVVVPCHRVIGSDGSLTGFGGGIERKKFLLTLEGVPVAAKARQRELFA